MIEISLQSRQRPESIHRMSGVENVEPVMDNERDILVYRLHIGGGAYMDYPASEWILTICGVRRADNGKTT